MYKSAVQARREFSKKRATVRANKKEDMSAQERFVAIDGADIEIKDYSAIAFEGQSLVLDLTGSGLHYILTAREKEVMDTKIIKVNGMDKEISVSTGVYIPEGFKDVGYNAKTVARIWRDENDGMVKMKCSKDRTHTYKEGVEIEDPSILEFQKMIERNKGRKAFAPENTMKNDIKREMEKVEREVLGTTIADAGKPAPTVEEALGTTAPVVNDGLEELKASYKAMYDELTPPQKESFKSALTAKGIKGVSTKGLDAAGVQARIDVLKELFN